MFAGTLVAVVDDDESVRESLPDLLREFGCDVQAYSSAEEFLASHSLATAECLILDIAMPGMSGMELQIELNLRRNPVPIIFITAQEDPSARPLVTERGAVACLFKPFAENVLLAALKKALKVE